MPAVDMSLDKLREYKGINPTPADFDEYWQGKMNEIESIEPVLLESVEVEDSKNVIYYFKVDAGKYGPVTGSVSYSKKAKRSRFL